MGVSIVVCVYNNAVEIPGLLSHIERQTFSETMELIIVDNSPAPSLDLVTLAATHVGRTHVVVVREERPGISAARQAGISAARFRDVLFTDPDSRPEPAWALAMVAALSDGYGLVGGKVTVDAPARFWSLPLDVRSLFVPPVWPEDRSPLEPPLWIIGCNMALRQPCAHTFSEQLGVKGKRHLSCEELELAHRVQGSGTRVCVEPDGVVRRRVTSDDLRFSRMVTRSYWQGVSMARVMRRNPSFIIYDDMRFLGPCKRSETSGARVVDVFGGIVIEKARVLGFLIELSRHKRRKSESPQ